MSTTSDTTNERLLWMAGFFAAFVVAMRSDGLVRATAWGAAAGYCFKRAA